MLLDYMTSGTTSLTVLQHIQERLSEAPLIIVRDETNSNAPAQPSR